MLDDRLSFVWNQLLGYVMGDAQETLTPLSNALSVVGVFALVVYTYPYLGLIFIPLAISYVSRRLDPLTAVRERILLSQDVKGDQAGRFHLT